MLDLGLKLRNKRSGGNVFYLIYVPSQAQHSLVERHQEPSRPFFIHSRTGLLLFTARDLWLRLSRHDPLPHLCLAPETVGEELPLFDYEAFEERASPQKSFPRCSGGREESKPGSTLKQTHGHYGGTFILLPFPVFI